MLNKETSIQLKYWCRYNLMASASSWCSDVEELECDNKDGKLYSLYLYGEQGGEDLRMAIFPFFRTTKT